MNKEKAVRDAAEALRVAIANATDAGLVVIWPRDADGLERIAVSQTGKASVVMTTDATMVDAETAAKAGIAAQKAATKVVEGAK